MLAAMADEQNVNVPESGAASEQVSGLAVERRRLGQLAGVPVRPLEAPRDDVLQPAETARLSPAGS